jgi:hypothetical protein
MDKLLRKAARFHVKLLEKYVSFVKKTLKAPISPDGDALFSLVNKSGKPDSSVFVQVVGTDPKTKKDFFIDYRPDGTFEYVFVHPGQDSKPFSFPILFFEEHDLYLPVGDGMRMYVSIDDKITFFVDEQHSKINAPDPHNYSDPSNKFVWDKFEFNVSPGAVFVNPTAVDSISLPIKLYEYGKDGVTLDGGLNIDRGVIFGDLKKVFDGTKFEKLIAPNGRIVFSPVDGSNVGLFPSDLFVTTGWLDSFKSVYSTYELSVDMSESFPPEKGGGIWRGFVKEDVLTFVRDVDDTHPKIGAVDIGIPTNVQDWLSGTGSAWKLDSDLKRAIARNVSAAVETNTLTTTEAIGKKYFDTARRVFYTVNYLVPDTLQFINLYSKVLHGYGDHKIYTYSYDDLLDQSGACSLLPDNFASGTIEIGKVFD